MFSREVLVCALESGVGSYVTNQAEGWQNFDQKRKTLEIIKKLSAECLLAERLQGIFELALHSLFDSRSFILFSNPQHRFSDLLLLPAGKRGKSAFFSG